MCEQTELRPLEEDAPWRCSVVCEQTELRPLGGRYMEVFSSV